MNRPRTREEAERMIGRRTPRPGEGKPPGPNWTPKPAEPDRRPRSMGNPSDPLGLKKNLRDREAAAGFKSGGMVRGCGKATRTKKAKTY